jgi:hypothetical protein
MVVLVFAKIENAEHVWDLYGGVGLFSAAMLDSVGPQCHVDLIVGLPSETMASVADGFNQLYALGSQEIQVGVLKRLRGMPLIAKAAYYDLRFEATAPYTILSTNTMDFGTVQRLVRFARYWDLVANSGRFTHTVRLMLAADHLPAGRTPFDEFLAFADWLYASTGATHQIAMDRLAKLVTTYLLSTRPHLQQEVLEAALSQDYVRLPMHESGRKKQPNAPKVKATPTRQHRHQMDASVL